MIHFEVSTDKDALSYACGEEIIFTVRAAANVNYCDCPKINWFLSCDDGKSSSGVGSISTFEPFRLTTTIDKPGFVRLQIAVLNNDGTDNKDYERSSSGVGADIDKIVYNGNIPEDFDEYWSNIEKTVEAFTPVALIKQRVDYPNHPAWADCYDMKISTPRDGMLTSGILTVPNGGGRYPIELIYVGYGVAGVTPVFEKDKICFIVNAHGFENFIERPAMERKYSYLAGYGFNNEENQRPETCYWNNMMLRDLVAAKWVKTVEAWDGKNIFVRGGSQGALQATTVAAHDKSVSSLTLTVPWFCDLNGEKKGYLAGWRPEANPGLEYFDTAIQGSRVTCPVSISAGLGDYVCPPRSVMALYNSIKSKKKIEFIQSKIHGEALWLGARYYREKDIEDDIAPGIYEHYKGNRYEVLYIAKNSETLEDDVVYKALYGNGGIWVRPKHMWTDIVCYNGETKRRFERVK